MWSVVVVAPEEAVEGCGPLRAGRVDRGVGPLVQHGADEALGLAVGLWPARARAQVADAERPAGDRVHCRAVGRAVVGQQAFDNDPVTAEEGHRPAQERARRRRLLVGQHLGVGQPGGVIDRDLHELPADRPAPQPITVGERRAVVLVAGDTLARAFDPPQLLDVDMDQLAGPRALVAAGGLEPDPPQPAEADAGEDARHGRLRHRQQLGDLATGEAQPAQRRDPPGRDPRKCGRRPSTAPTSGRTGQPRPRRGSARPTCRQCAR